MKVYTDRKTAPLKFHKFLIWFSLPLGVLVSLVNAMRYVSAGYPADIFFFFDMGYQLLLISLTVLSIIGLWRYHRSGPLLLYARQALSICYCFLAILIFNAYNLPTSELSSDLSRGITWLVIFVIYYQKRMPLFESDKKILLEQVPADPILQETFSDAPAAPSCIQSDGSVASAFPASEAPSEVVTIKVSESPAPKQSRLPHLWGVHSSRMLVGLLTAALVVSGAFNAYQYSTQVGLQAQIKDLESQVHKIDQDYTKVQADYVTAKNQIECIHAILNDRADSISYLATRATALDILIRAASIDGSMLYHRIDCAYSGRSILMQRSYAESLGYRPCPVCCDDNSAISQEFNDNYNSVLDLLKLIHDGSDRDWYIAGTVLKAFSESNDQ